MAFFSIVTVTYNAAGVLVKTLDSVFQQDFQDFEYIIVDGGSNDGTVELIEGYPDRFSAVVSEPDKGLYDAMNKALGLVRGDFVLFLNAGDVLADNHVLGDVQTAIPDSRAVRLLYGDYIVKSRRMSKYISSARAHERLRQDFFFCHQAIFYNRAFLEPYDLSFPVKADYDLTIRVLQKSRPEEVVHLGKALVIYALAGHSTANLANNIRDSIRLHARYWGWLRVLRNTPRYCWRIGRSLKERVMDQ